MRSRLLVLTLLAALTLGSNQFGGGSMGGSSVGRVNRAPVAQATSAERVGPGTVQLSAAASTDETIVGGGFPGPLSYEWEVVYPKDGTCTPSGSDTADVFTLIMENTTAGCICEVEINDGRLKAKAYGVATVSEDTPPQVSVAMDPVTEGGNLTISGSATDDSGGTCADAGLTCTHTMIQSPAGDAGSYSDASVEDPTYGVVTAGGYESQLCVDDGVNPPVCATTGLVNVTASGSVCAVAECFETDPFASGRWVQGEMNDALYSWNSGTESVDFDASTVPARGEMRPAATTGSMHHYACAPIPAMTVGTGAGSRALEMRVDPDDPNTERYHATWFVDGSFAWRFYSDASGFTDVNTAASSLNCSGGCTACAYVAGEEDSETRRACTFTDYPASPGDPSTWAGDVNVTACESWSGSGFGLSGAYVGLRDFSESDTTPGFTLSEMDYGAVNQAPVADAGADTNDVGGGSVPIQGTCDDDGLPTQTLTPTWSFVTGTGAGEPFENASFADENDLSTTIDGAADVNGSGDYRLTCSDGTLSGTDDATLTVSQTGEPSLQVSPLTHTSTATAGESDGSADTSFVSNDGAAGSSLDWSTANLTAQDCTADGSAPNGNWVQATGSGAGLRDDDPAQSFNIPYGDSQGCDLGDWTWSVQVTSAEADDSPVTITGTLTVQAPGSSTVTAEIEPNQTAGFAPLAVYFDAKGTTQTGKSAVEAQQDLWYVWDFGKTEAGETPGTWGDWTGGAAAHNDAEFLQRFGKDEDAGGYISGAVYEPESYPASCDGTPAGDGVACRIYTACVTAKDDYVSGSSGDEDTACTNIEVWDPGAIFPGTNTVCIANSLPTAGAGGCPVGAKVVASSTASDIRTEWGDGKRVLLNRGDAWSGNIGELDDRTVSTGSIIGAYGTGAKPDMNAAGSGSFLIPHTQKIVVMDLDIDKPLGDNGRIFDCQNDGEHFEEMILLRNEARGGTEPYSCQQSGGREYYDIALVENFFEDGEEKDLFTGCHARCLKLGNIFGGSDTSHSWRVNPAHEVVFAFNLNHKPGSISALKIASGDAHKDLPGAASMANSSHVRVAYNTESGGGPNSVSPSAASSKIYENNWFWIVEGNYWGRPDGSLAVMAGMLTKSTVRENIQIRNNGFAFYLQNQGVESNDFTGQDVFYRHNTMYENGSNCEMVLISGADLESTASRHYHDNLLYCPGSTGSSGLENLNDPATDVGNSIVTDSGSNPFSVADPDAFCELVPTAGEGTGAWRGPFGAGQCP